MIHSIDLVKEIRDKVVLAAIDYDWLEKYVKAHPSDVPSATFGSRHMLTAWTTQLQRLLVDNQARFTHLSELHRQAIPAAN